MLTNIARFVMASLCGSLLCGQPLDRVLHLSHAESDQQLHEIAADIRGITEIPQVSVDTAQKILIMHGTAAQIAAAEWMLNQLDESAAAQIADNPAAHEYRVSGDDVVRVFHLAHAPTGQQLQEVATDVRSIANIRRLFTYTTSSAITVRGDPSQIALCAWLVSQLDRTAGQTSRDYRPLGTVDDVVRIFYPAHTGSPQGLQEIATDVRSIGNIHRLFTYNAIPAIVARGTGSEMALAQWLMTELDQPGQPLRPSDPHEYRPSGTVDDVVRVFFLAHADTPIQLQQIAVVVRTTTQVNRIFIYNAPHALVLRGTAAQIAWAGRLIAERDR